MILLLQPEAVCQIDTTLKEFYPLHLGDLWQYRDQNNVLGFGQVGVVDTVLSNGKQYFGIGMPPDFSNGFGFTRCDSMLRAEYFGGPSGDTCGGLPGEYSIYHLDELAGSVWEICRNVVATLCHPWFMRYEGISTQTIFGQSRDVMRFTPGAYCPQTNDTVWYFVDWLLVRGIGIYREETIENTYRYLTGAIVNGVTYGTIVAVADNPATIPSAFILKPNYPNPFNPTTTIRYELPEASYVTLSVYDILGKEVSQIVNEEQPAGKYQRIFDASNLSSGVYLYTLNAGRSLHVRLMHLVK